jgi:molybdate transport system substrate-binding protein
VPSLRPLALLLVLGATACTSSAARAPSATITVYAAASLTSTFTELAHGFEATHAGTTVKLSFGASSGLAQQVLAGAPADVFASASPKNMKQVTDGGEAKSPETFARNVAEIAVAPASAGRVRALADLAKPGVQVALCQPQVPCGAVAQEVLANARLKVRPVTQGLDVKSTLGYVTSGQVDAAVVYVTDVLAAGSKVTGVPIASAVNAGTSYEIAPLTRSGSPRLAEAFVAYVLSPAGQSVLRKAGFEPP